MTSRKLRSRVVMLSSTTPLIQSNVKLKHTKISDSLGSRSDPDSERNASHSRNSFQTCSTSSESTSVSEVTSTPARKESRGLKKPPNSTGSIYEESPTIVLQVDGILICDAPKCNYQTSFKNDLKRHQTKQHKSKRLKCPQCDYVTHSEDAYTRHTGKHDSKMSFKCTLCPWTYPVLSLLTQHMKQIHERAKLLEQGISRSSEFGKRFKCSKCDFRAVCKQEIHLHNYSHGTEKNYKCSFPGCEYRAKMAYTLKQHLKRHDVKAKKEFQCPLCPKLFWTKSVLYTHIHFHTKERAHPCSKCKYVANYPSTLKKHMSTHAKKSDQATDMQIIEESIGVEYCGRFLETSDTTNSKSIGSGKVSQNEATTSKLEPNACNSQKVIKKQRKKPTKIPEKNYKCDHCDYTAINQSKIIRHAVVHRDLNDKLYSCSFPGCDFKTNWEDYVKKHYRDFHKSTPDLMCPVAGCGFQTKWNDFLAKHKKVHAKRRKRVHQCPMCRKAFYDSCGLKRHINIHTGEKKYQCSLCDYVSGESSNFYAHRRKYHPGQESRV